MQTEVKLKAIHQVNDVAPGKAFYCDPAEAKRLIALGAAELIEGDVPVTDQEKQIAELQQQLDNLEADGNRWETAFHELAEHVETHHGAKVSVQYPGNSEPFVIGIAYPTEAPASEETAPNDGEDGEEPEAGNDTDRPWTELTQLPKVSNARAEHLYAMGIKSIADLAGSVVEHVSVTKNISEKVAAELISSAKEYLEKQQ